MSEGAGQARGMRRLYATALELGPLVLFFVANAKWGIFTGTAVFVVATAVALPCYRWLEKRWPVMPLVGGFFVLVFGGLTIWLQDDTFIKLKPTIVNCLFGVILGGGLLFLQRPLLKPIFGAAFAHGRGLAQAPCAALLLRKGGGQRGDVAASRLRPDRQQDVPRASRSPSSSPSCRSHVFKRYWDGEDNPFG
jgi:intracellular septation protein